MKHAYERNFPMISAHYAAVLARYMQREGISPEVLLDGTGVPISALREPEVYLSVAQIQRLIEQACRLVPRESLGFEFGRTIDLSAHGLLGFSILRRERLRELVGMVVTVIRVRLPLLDIRLTEDGPRQHLQMEDTWDLGTTRHFVTGMYLGSILSIASLATRDLRLEFDCAAPRTTRGFHGLDRGQVVFGQAACRATLTYHSRPAWQEENRAPELIAKLGAHETGITDEAEIVLRLRRCVLSNPGRDCTLESVAERMGLSARSLRRHLQETGQSFTDIRNCVRLEFARRLLRGSSLPIEEIAEQVGYGDQASFSKAFSAWTGTSPGRYRRAGNTLEEAPVLQLPMRQAGRQNAS
ncbi:MAG: helix-turn-helix domain-containing protein [Pseudomonadota bacterium]